MFVVVPQCVCVCGGGGVWVGVGLEGRGGGSLTAAAPIACGSLSRIAALLLLSVLRVDTVVASKVDFTLVTTAGHCSTVQGRFLIVLDFLVATTSTDTLASTGTLDMWPLSNNSLGKLVTTVSPLKRE